MAKKSGKSKGKKKRPKRKAPGPHRGPGPGLVPGFSNRERLELEKVFARLLRGMRKDLGEDPDPLTVQIWTSHSLGIWWGRELIGLDTEAVFCGGLVDHAASRKSSEAVGLLRSLSEIAPEPYAKWAKKAADRLVAVGVAEPPWAGAVTAPVEATSAAVVSDPVDDDGVNVVIGFDGGVGPHTLCVYVDHNLGGMAKDLILAPVGLPEFVDTLKGVPGYEDLVVRDLDVTEAAARARKAFTWTDHTLDPPVTEDFPKLRAIALARLAALPETGEAPEPARLDQAERDAILDGFLASPFAGALTHEGMDEDLLADLAFQVLNYSCDYVGGTALRFSPVMVEIFCFDWAPRKVPGDDAAFDALPDVLRAWIRFVGARRGIPADRVEAAVEAVSVHEDELREAAADPESWGPAKALVQAMARHGVDLADQRQVEAFIEQVNDGEVDVLL